MFCYLFGTITHYNTITQTEYCKYIKQIFAENHIVEKFIGLIEMFITGEGSTKSLKIQLLLFLGVAKIKQASIPRSSINLLMRAFIESNFVDHIIIQSRYYGFTVYMILIAVICLYIL